MNNGVGYYLCMATFHYGGPKIVIMSFSVLRMSQKPHLISVGVFLHLHLHSLFSTEAFQGLCGAHVENKRVW